MLIDFFSVTLIVNCTFKGLRINDKHNTSLVATIDKCSQVQTLRVDGEELNTQGSRLLADGSKVLDEAKNFFQNLVGTFERMKKTGLQLVKLAVL